MKKLLNKINNIFLQFKSICRYFLHKNKNKVKISNEYQLVFEDNFESDLTNWGKAHTWGWFHPDYLHQYYGTGETFSYIKDGKLNLETRYQPIHVIKSELPEWQQSEKLPDEFDLDYGVGLIHSKNSWQYGWFTADIKLPVGKYLWPAFWLAGVNSWPPEIDIFEGYTLNDTNYLKKFLGFKLKWWKIQPNAHYGSVDDGSKKMWGTYDVPTYKATENFIEYALHWEKDFIKIYYAGKLVMKITDPNVLTWFNGEKDQQQIILGNGTNFKNEKVDNSIMYVDNIKVYQKI
jgi:beta-glucanase (GH16 family)